MKQPACWTQSFSAAGIAAVSAFILLVSLPPTSARGSVVQIAPTSVADSVLRGGAGKFGAPRPGGKKHAGVDIVSRQTATDKARYKVLAVSEGAVAYAGYNGDVTKGYGYTVIVDHGNDVYTLYGHLATLASANLVKVGESVKRGQILGYMADLANGEKSSGNVLAEVVGKYDKIQLHFEEFMAPSGRSSKGLISDIKKLDFKLIDPTGDLLSFGYAVYSD
jgi:murein DD-endopeptidase MepM/ murein hydrolase activator NlpD